MTETETPMYRLSKDKVKKKSKPSRTSSLSTERTERTETSTEPTGRSERTGRSKKLEYTYRDIDELEGFEEDEEDFVEEEEEEEFKGRRPRPSSRPSKSSRECKCGGTCDRCKPRPKPKPKPKPSPCECGKCDRCKPAPKCKCGGGCSRCKSTHEFWPCSKKQANQPAALFRAKLPDLSTPLASLPIPGFGGGGLLGAAPTTVPAPTAVYERPPSRPSHRADLKEKEEKEEKEEEEEEEVYELKESISPQEKLAAQQYHLKKLAAHRHVLRQAALNAVHQRTHMLMSLPHVLQEHLGSGFGGGLLDESSTFDPINVGRTGVRRARLEPLIKDPSRTITKGGKGLINLKDIGTYNVFYGALTALIDPNSTVTTVLTGEAPGTPVPFGFPGMEIISSDPNIASNFAFVAVFLFAKTGGECDRNFHILPGSINILLPTGVMSLAVPDPEDPVLTPVQPDPTTFVFPPTAIAFTSNFIQRLQANTLIRTCECNTEIGLGVAAVSSVRNQISPFATPVADLTPAVPLFFATFDSVVGVIKVNSAKSPDSK